MLIAAALYANINNIAVLVYRSPEILSLDLNCDKDLLDMPGVA